MNGEGGTNGSHANSIPTSVPLTASQFQINCRLDDDDDDDDDSSLSIHAQTQQTTGVNESSYVNDLAPDYVHFCRSVMSDFTLPKFKDYIKQNIVSFLEDLYSYVQLNIVPAEMKLPREMKPVTEEYTQ
jgi:hypothetical protein